MLRLYFTLPPSYFLLQCGNHVAVGGNQIVAQIPNLVEREFGGGMGIEGGGVIDVLALAGQGSFDRQ